MQFGIKDIVLTVFSILLVLALGLITAHAIEAGRVTLERIVMGQHVTVGTMAIVFPGVRMGDYGVVAAGAVVPRGTHIGPGEVWAGVPARKVGLRTREPA